MNYCTSYCDGKQLLQRHPLRNTPHSPHTQTKGRFRNDVTGWFWQMYPRSGFWYRGTSECTFVPFFWYREHPNVPSFRSWSPKPPFLRTPERPSYCNITRYGATKELNGATTGFLKLRRLQWPNMGGGVLAPHFRSPGIREFSEQLSEWHS